MIPLFLEANNIPFTGCSSHSIQVTSDKVLSKNILLQAGLPTPAWQRQGKSLGEFDLNLPVIIKAISEHASFDLDDSSVARYQSSTEVESSIRERKQKTGRDYFAEQFISGREFNLSILEGESGPEVLPAAEIDFSRFPRISHRLLATEPNGTANLPNMSSLPGILETIREIANCLSNFGNWPKPAGICFL